jgi:hypothetical protein
MRILGRRDEEAAEKLADMHGAIEMQAIKKICIEGIIETDLEMRNERKAW